MGVLLPILLLGWNGMVQEEGSEKFREQAQSTLSKGPYQTELPFGKGGGAAGLDPDRRLRPFPVERRERSDAPGSVSVPLGKLAEVLLYVIGGTAVVIGVIWLVRGLLGAADRAKKPAVAAVGQEKSPQIREKHVAESHSPEEWLRRADALAAEGRHSEAVHAVLLCAIHFLSLRGKRVPSESMTSRELVSLFSLQGARRDSFQSLVSLVEAAWFGGHPVGSQEFVSARERLQILREGTPA